MRAIDFNFLRRKDIWIMFIILLLISFFQIALSKFGVRYLPVEPIVYLNNPILEIIGVILPFFAVLFVFVQNRSEREYFWVPPLRMIFGVSVIALLIALFVLLSPSLDISPDPEEGNGTLTTTISNPTYVSTNPISDPNQGFTSNPVSIPEDFSKLLTEFRNIIILFIVLLPFLILLNIQRKAKYSEQEQPKTQEIELGDDKTSQRKTRTILECYYQTSSTLEERGANDSESFTPTEFTVDVVNKKLSSHSSIGDLTYLFEEAKFSTHEMSTIQVEAAKKLATDIIFENKSISDEDDKIKEHDQRKNKNTDNEE